MNFQNLKAIETADKYLDVAIKRSKKKADLHFQSLKSTQFDKKMRLVEELRLDVFSETLKGSLDAITTDFPRIEQLSPFYIDLIKVTVDFPLLKKSLGAMNWASNKIEFFTSRYRQRLKKTRDAKTIPQYKREYYGRVSSVMKQIKDELIYLEHCRKVMKSYPAIKSKIFTVCIAGFPNVGKSTLLSKLTTATPEINSYPFTTKTLNVGYIIQDYRKIQLIDTPGTLNRFEKMNEIEKQAYLAIKHVADHVIYVFDPTEEYPVDDQVKLLLEVRKSGKPILGYISKTDIADADKVEDLKKRIDNSFTDADSLKKELMSIRNKLYKGDVDMDIPLSE